MHEVALHAGYSNDDMQPPFTEDSLKGVRPTQAARLSAGHIGSLSTCLSAIHKIFDIFLSLTTDTIRSSPTLHFVRIVYSAVVLSKMAYDATVPGSEIGKVFKSDDFKIDYYFDALVGFLKIAAEGGRCASAGKFAMVLFIMKNLLRKQKGDNLNTLHSSLNNLQNSVTDSKDGRRYSQEGTEQIQPQPLWQQPDQLPISVSGLRLQSGEVQDQHTSPLTNHSSHSNISPHSLLPDSNSINMQPHYFQGTGLDGFYARNSEGQSLDHLMSDYDFDPQSFQIDHEDFPSYFPDDNFLGSAMQHKPDGYFDAWP